MTRAKFKVSSKTIQEAGDSKTYSVILYPVTSGSPENEAFFASTPSGTIQLSLTKEEVYQQFEYGKEYYIDFTLVA